MMTYGDAIMVIKRRTDPLEKILEALELIFDKDFKYNYYCLSKQDLWEITKYLYDISKNTKGEVICELSDLLEKVNGIESREKHCDYASSWCICREDVTDIIEDRIVNLTS